ncbi:hypothetical protein TNCV_3523981 [Trichonephila clavipes]|uniref:Uncharacterized protein n=1 Tax=Trichonephila clavipes TaxID=2585209 RepID=A0A8X6S301_TRICX|nr:hypothetical protein TNCV_3523981 [Trichonephila clavipes]
MWGFLGAMGPVYIFMDDSARTHRTSIVDELHEGADFRCMDEISKSPDHNSIEYYWDGLGKAISQSSAPPPGI